MSNLETPKIDTFKDLMNEISYSFTDTPHSFINHGNGEYSFNKLYVGPTSVQYKVDNWELCPKVYEKFLTFMKLLET